MAEKKLTYTAAMAELERIVAEIEAGDVDVDVLAAKVKRSQELVNFCSTRLRGAQETVEKILGEMQKTGEPDAAGEFDDGE